MAKASSPIESLIAIKRFPEGAGGVLATKHRFHRLYCVVFDIFFEFFGIRF